MRIQRENGDANTDNLWTFYACEAVHSKVYAGTTVTLSFWAKLTGSNLTPYFYLKYEHSEVSSYMLTVGGGHNAAGPVTPAGATWMQYTLTATLPADAAQIGVYFYIVPSGTAGADDSLYVTGVRLNRGTVPAPYVWEYANELRRCQRYFQKSYSAGVVPGTTTQAAGLEVRVVPSTTVVTIQYYGSVRLCESMRTTCTPVVYGYSGTQGTVSDYNGTDLAASSGSTESAGDMGFSVFNGNAGSITAPVNRVMFHWTASAEL
jgi:hypothetical protein